MAMNLDRPLTVRIALQAILVTILVLVAYRYARIAWPRWRQSRLGHRLAKQGWVLYARAGCGYCTKQAKLFPGGYPNTVHCDGAAAATAPCSAIKGFPHWRNSKTGVERVGYQDAAALTAMLSA
jgi:hypothetical protein